MCGKACADSEVCTSGKCAGCPPLQTKCGGACADTGSDEKNCGMCGKACMANQQCVAGICL